MSGMNWKQCTLALLPLMVSSGVYAERAGFYTIVGPDGRIMVIDRNAAAASKSENADKKPNNAVTDRQANPVEVQKEVAAQPATSPVTVAPLPRTSAAASLEAAFLAQPKKVPGAAIETVKPSQPVVEQGSVKPQELIVLPPVANTQKSSVKSAVSTQPQSAVIPAAQVAVQGQKKQPVLEQKSATVTDSPVTVIDGEKYIQSEYLEQKEFNLEGKKRFYSLPDDLGGTQILQREKGVDMNVFKGPQVEAAKVVTLSRNYQRINAGQVTELTGVQCFTKDQLEKAKLLKTKASLDFWPRPSFEPKFDFVIAEFESVISDIELTSYAATTRNPVFYWPLPVFLDKNACVLEGVNAFYQRSMAANSIQHQAIQGFLHVPNGAKYLLLTPLESAADLSDLKLTNKGQVRLTPIR